MKRNFARRCTLVCLTLLSSAALVMPGSAFAGSSSRIEARGFASGTIALINDYSFTIQTPGRPTGVVNALGGAANRVTAGDYPYVYGGGHAEAGVASIGIKGPGYNGHRIGFDCSGSVAAVLAGAGLWPAGAGVPNDAGIIAQLLRERLIARGVGTGPVEVTLYDRPGVHIFMNIDGRFFGTSDGGGGGNRRGGAGWLDDGAPDASTPLYKPYHLLPSVLKQSTNAGHSVTFEVGGEQSSIGGLAVGENVQVGYEETSSGTILATAIGYPGSLTASGTVGSVAGDGSAFAIQTASGQSLTFSTASPQLAAGLAVGDTVQVTYTPATSEMIAHEVEVTGTPAGASGSSGVQPGGSGQNTG